MSEYIYGWNDPRKQSTEELMRQHEERKEELEAMAKMSKYSAEAARLKPSVWVDPRGLSSLSTDEDCKAADEKIRKEYDSLFGAVTLSGSPVTWSTVSPSSWSIAMPKEELSVNPFLDKVVKMEYVGSRVTCSPAPIDTDEDVLLLTDDLGTLIGDCIEVGFTRDIGTHLTSYPTDFVSLRSGTMNFIVTDNEEFFEKFMLATYVCKSLNLINKSDRITVFQAILYGKEYAVSPLP